MDYIIQGSCFSDLGLILDGSAVGEIGISSETFYKLPIYLQNALARTCIESNEIFILYDRDQLITSLNGFNFAPVKDIDMLENECYYFGYEMDSDMKQIISKFANKAIVLKQLQKDVTIKNVGNEPESNQGYQSVGLTRASRPGRLGNTSRTGILLQAIFKG
jgi:hypothetical protein